VADPTVSIVVPAYNASATISRCLAACAAQTYPAHEIIVVDDGSTDGTAAVARAVPGTIVIAQVNAGPATARNAGARAATGDLVVFTDADCVPHPDWIEALADTLPPTVAGLGGTYALANPESWLAGCIQAEIAARHAGFMDGLPPEAAAVDVDFLGSFNVAFRRDVFLAAGGFDPRFRAASAEDNDLSYRLTAAGQTLCFTPAAVVAHYHPEQVWPYLRTQARHGYWRVFLYSLHPGRSGGDRYASRGDLLRPPALVLGPLVCAGVAWAGQGAIAAGILTGVLGLIGCSALASVRAWAGRVPRLHAADFLGVVLLRDLARSLGLLRGVLDFVVLRRGRKAPAGRV
jgi:GT2 family glycosyltransferase